MKYDVLQKIAEYGKAHRSKKRWYRMFACLAAIVVFCTTYALILPAITLEKGPCEIPEHVHTEECYTQVTSVSEQKLRCTSEILNLHQHTSGCYDADGELSCGYADFVVHEHDSSCYDENGNLWCSLPEIEEHEHDDSCYAEVTSGKKSEASEKEDTAVPEYSEGEHIHTGECYTLERGELICTGSGGEAHVHDESCYTEEQVLVCDLPEREGHVHDEDCYDEEGELICDREEEEGHEHGDSCYETELELCCGYSESEESVHEHTDDCYEWNEVLICNQSEKAWESDEGALANEIEDWDESEEEEESLGEPKLICREEEIVLHEHTADCFDDSGNLICGKLQVLAHQHTDACFETVEVPTDQMVLTCPLQEHLHSEVCQPAQETAEEETTVEETNTEETTAEEIVETEQTEEETKAEETLPEETVEETAESLLTDDLPVIGTVYVSGGTKARYAVMLLAEEESTDTEDTVTTDPLNVEEYVTAATLYYRTDDSSEWKNVEGETDIPGDADFKLVVKYESVSISDLLAAGGKMTFALPSLLRNPVAEGKITSGATEVGTITAEGSIVTLSFDTEWLKKQQTGSNAVLNGDFFVEAEANLSEIGGGEPGQIVIGNVTITIDFADDLIAQYGNVDIEKSTPTLSEEADGDYLTYTLTVTAGEDGCPEVKIVDQFTATDYIEEYVGVTGIAKATNDGDGPEETIENGKTAGTVYIGVASENNSIPEPAGENAEEPGVLVWVIGDMAAKETRTLEYRVKLKDDYTGASSRGILQNTAEVFSKSYERDSDTQNFEPKAGLETTKTAEAAVNEDGSYTITYTVWVKAKDDNSYTLDQVSIIDALDGSQQNTNATDAALRPYLLYVEESFELFDGGAKNQKGSTGLAKSDPAGTLTLSDTDNDKKMNDSFIYVIGPLEKGECKTLIYQVKVSPEVFSVAGNGDVKIKNRACAFGDGAGEESQAPWAAANREMNLSHKVWARKLVGSRQEIENMVSLSGSVYDATGNAVAPITEPEASFTVPVGSYQYQVVANEAGDWNLSSASMKDSLSNQYMQFVGYIQVNAYTIAGDAPSSDLSDESVIANLSARTPDKTVWVKVDGLQSFEFKPEEIGLKGKYAYLLTYYAQPVNLDGVTQVVVGNTFSLEGGVIGPGSDTEYILTGIEAKASVTVEGTNSFSAKKMSWYYEASKVVTGDFANGALYWVIQVDGNVLPKGTQLKDITNASGGTAHYIRGTSLVGVYTGALDKQIVEYDDWETLSSQYLLNPLAENIDFELKKTNNELTVKLFKDIVLSEQDSLYIIVKTEPSSLPTGKRDSKAFNNKLQSSFDGENWLDHNITSKTLYGSENVFKELGRVFTYTGSGGITDIQGGTKQAIDTTALNEAGGTYAAWQIHVNYEGNLSGRYRVEEQIPNGMEVAYVRIWWAGSKITAQENRPINIKLTSEELADLGSGWTEHFLSSATNGIGTQTTYYYTNGQQVIWDVGNLIPGGERDTYAVEYQIVCRVTDPDVLLGNESKVFNNTVSLFNSNGENIGTDSHDVTIQKKTLAKTGTYDPNTNGGRYPFKITLNELGEDLVSGADTITLVDELSDTLILDTTSITVMNTKTNEVVSNCTSSVDGQTLKMVLPDNLPLTITYETTVNAAPGQVVSISNNAHWEGYTTPSGGSVSDSNFTYAVGGTVGVEQNPSIVILKRDQNNTSICLAGAEFSLQEGSYENGSFTAANGGLELTGVTDENGSLIFGREDAQRMQYNTVYCLTETKAPEGYVLDSAPHYFAVAKQNDDGSYPTFPDGVTVWYQGAVYTYQVYNHKGEIYVEKKFIDGGGQPVEKLDGTYRFGIYEKSDGESLSEQPLKTVSIQYANGTVTPEGGIAKFTDLDPTKTYVVYELDDGEKPIQDETIATVDGKLFRVTYSRDSQESDSFGESLNDVKNNETVTVTNHVCYAELPETGGTGSRRYTIGGLLLMAFAGFFLLYHNYKKRGRGEFLSL